jgi:exosortase H (IPTLxxWG-CTERM-specific)
VSSRQSVTAPRPLRPRLVFVARFVAAMVVLYAVVALNAVNDAVIVPFTEVVARGSALLLRGVESGVGTAGTVIRSPRFALDVRNGCNGVEAAILLAAAILAFPATLRSRLAGLAVAGVAIELLNLVRLSFLFWLGEHDRRIFDFFHVAVWQSLIILAAISIFVLWSWKFAERPLAQSR